jgi:hypothetical protein
MGEPDGAAANNGGQGFASTVAVASLPWVFTQQHPLDTSSFISEANRRGFDLDLDVMRELYRHALLVPFVYASDRQAGPIPETLGPEPKRAIYGSTHLGALRHARDRGRLADLTAVPFRRKLRFERPGAHPLRWWNGLIYSRYQLLVLPELRDLLGRRRLRLR